MSRNVVTLVTIGIWVGIFAAGLWPFNFVPGNRIQWLPGGAGLHFDGYGQVYSTASIPSPKAPDASADATIELAFIPSKSYDSASTFFSLVNRDEVRLAIGQSLTDLFLQGSFTEDGGKPVGKLWVDYACAHEQELFVTVVLDRQTLDVYLDGQAARSFPVSTRARNVSGRIVVGHSAKGGGQWSGSVARLAIFDGALDSATISRRYQQWTRDRHLDGELDHRGATYEFVRPAGDVVSHIGRAGPDLIVPKTFRLSVAKVLEWPDQLNRSVSLDAVVNIAGFIPFGLSTCLCLRLWTGWSVSRCVGMTVLIGASVSLAVELLQVMLPSRDSSLADVVTNVVGTLLGAGATVIRR